MSNPIIVPDDYEVETSSTPWVMRHPSASLTIGAGFVVLLQGAGAHFIQKQQAPQWTRVNDSINRLATHQLEQARYSDRVWKAIASSAGVSMPDRPPELDRSAGRVRDMRERHP